MRSGVWLDAVQRTAVVPPHPQVALRVENDEVVVTIAIDVEQTKAAGRCRIRQDGRLTVDHQAERVGPTVPARTDLIWNAVAIEVGEN